MGLGRSDWTRQPASPGGGLCCPNETKEELCRRFAIHLVLNDPRKFGALLLLLANGFPADGPVHLDGC